MKFFVSILLLLVLCGGALGDSPPSPFYWIPVPDTTWWRNDSSFSTDPAPPAVDSTIITRKKIVPLTQFDTVRVPTFLWTGKRPDDPLLAWEKALLVGDSVSDPSKPHIAGIFWLSIPAVGGKYPDHALAAEIYYTNAGDTIYGNIIGQEISVNFPGHMVFHPDSSKQLYGLIVNSKPIKPGGAIDAPYATLLYLDMFDVAVDNMDSVRVDTTRAIHIPRIDAPPDDSGWAKFAIYAMDNIYCNDTLIVVDGISIVKGSDTSWYEADKIIGPTSWAVDSNEAPVIKSYNFAKPDMLQLASDSGQIRFLSTEGNLYMQFGDSAWADGTMPIWIGGPGNSSLALINLKVDTTRFMGLVRVNDSIKIGNYWQTAANGTDGYVLTTNGAGWARWMDAAGGGTSDSIGIDTDGDGTVDDYIYPSFLKRGGNITFTVTGDTLIIAGPAGAGTADSMGIDADGDGTFEAYLYSTVGGAFHLKKGANITFTVENDTVTISGQAAAGTADSMQTDTSGTGDYAKIYSTSGYAFTFREGPGIDLTVDNDTVYTATTLGVEVDSNEIDFTTMDEWVSDQIIAHLGGTETGIAVTGQDGTNDIDFVVDDDIRKHTLDTTEVLDILRDSISGDATVGAAGELSITPNAVESTMIGVGQVNDLDINFGTSTDQVSATDLPDFGTMTATDDNILVADGTDFESVAMSGEATINNGVIDVIDLDSLDMTNAGVAEADLGISNTPTDEYALTWEADEGVGGRMKWEAQAGATGSADSTYINTGTQYGPFINDMYKIKEGTGINIVWDDSTDYDVFNFNATLGTTVDSSEITDSTLSLDDLNWEGGLVDARIQNNITVDEASDVDTGGTKISAALNDRLDDLMSEVYKFFSRRYFDTLTDEANGWFGDTIICILSDSTSATDTSYAPLIQLIADEIPAQGDSTYWDDIADQVAADSNKWRVPEATAYSNLTGGHGITHDPTGTIKVDTADAVADAETKTVTGNAVYDYGVANYQPLEATLTDIADGIIDENLDNTINPWAANEIVSTVIHNDEMDASSELLAIMDDETGTGVLVFATAPTFTTDITVPLVIGGTATTSDLSLKTTSGVGATGADMHFLVGNNGGTEAMTILNDGNVGVGINSPSSIFHIKADIPGVVGSHSAGQFIIQNPTNSVFSNAVITGYESDAAGNPDQQLWYLGGSSGSNSDIIFLNRRNSKLELGTNGTAQLTIDGDGKVGIGTATPSEKLSVAGNISVTGTVDTVDVAALGATVPKITDDTTTWNGIPATIDDTVNNWVENKIASNNTQTRITLTYQSADSTIDFVVDDMTWVVSDSESAMEAVLDLEDLQGTIDAPQLKVASKFEFDGGAYKADKTVADSQFQSKNYIDSATADAALNDALVKGKLEATAYIAAWNWKWHPAISFDYDDPNNPNGLFLPYATHADTNELWPTDSTASTGDTASTYAAGHPDYIHIPSGWPRNAGTGSGMSYGRWTHIFSHTPLHDSLKEDPCIIVFDLSDSTYKELYIGADSVAGEGYIDSTLDNPVFTETDFDASSLMDANLDFTHDGALLLTFRGDYAIPARAKIFNAWSFDGLTWTVDTIAEKEGNQALLSPTTVMSGENEYKLFCVDGSNYGDSNVLEIWTATNYDTTYTFDTTATIPIPAGYHLWHLKIRPLTSKHFYMLAFLCDSGAAGTGNPQGLFWYESEDAGLNWRKISTGNPGRFLTNDGASSAWYGTGIYRGSWVWEMTAQGLTADIVYGGYRLDGNNKIWRVGRTRVYFYPEDIEWVDTAGVIPTKGWVSNDIGDTANVVRSEVRDTCELSQAADVDTAGTDIAAALADRANIHDTLTKSFAIRDIDDTYDFPFWMTPKAITLIAASGVCIDGTNVVGVLMEYDNDAANPAVCNSSDWTFTTGEERTTSLSNASIDAGDWLGWKTTSVSGEVTTFTLTFEYTVD